VGLKKTKEGSEKIKWWEVVKKELPINKKADKGTAGKN